MGTIWIGSNLRVCQYSFCERRWQRNEAGIYGTSSTHQSVDQATCWHSINKYSQPAPREILPTPFFRWENWALESVKPCLAEPRQKKQSGICRNFPVSGKEGWSRVVNGFVNVHHVFHEMPVYSCRISKSRF